MKILFYALLVGITITACSPNEDQPNFELLTTGEWQLQRAMKDTISTLSDCRQNDVVTFLPDGDLDYVNNSEDCAEGELTGKSWKFQNSGEVVRTKFGTRGGSIGLGVSFEYWRIVELTADRLVLEDDIAESNDQIPEVRTYTH